MEIPILKIPFNEEDVAFISKHLKDMLLKGQLAMGKHTFEFERQFASFCATPYAVACANGTAALEMICRALEVEGASVAIPNLTFMATALAPIAAGAKIILIDCEPKYFQMDPDDLAKKIRPDTKAVILVHLGGLISPKYKQIREICTANGAFLVEDAAHAHGAEIDGQMAGSLGQAAAFSFYPTKVLTTAEGGMVSCHDEHFEEKLKQIRQHGQKIPGSNQHQDFGLNYRPSEIHSLLGLAMMKKAGWILKQRRQAAQIYDDLLNNSALHPVLQAKGQRGAYYKYIALLPKNIDRDFFKKSLKDDFKISLAGEVYSHCLNNQEFFKIHPEALAVPPSSLDVSEDIAKRQICLPIYPGLKEEEQEYIVQKLLKLIADN